MTQKLVFFGAGNMAQAIFTKLITKTKFDIEIINRLDNKKIGCILNDAAYFFYLK